MMWNGARLWRRMRARQQMVGAYLRAVVEGTWSAAPAQAHARLRARVEPRLRALMADAMGIDVETLTARTSLTEDLAMDSLDVLDVVIRTEAEFAVVFPDREVGALRTYGDLAAATIALVACRLRALEAEREWAGMELRLGGAGAGEVPRFLRVLDASPYDRELLREDVRAARTTDTIEVSPPPEATADTLAEIERMLARTGATAMKVRPAAACEQDGAKPDGAQPAAPLPADAEPAAEVTIRALPLVGHLVAERETTVRHLVSDPYAFDAELSERRSATDSSVAELQSAVDAHRHELRDSDSAVGAAAGELGRLPALRSAVDQLALGSEDARAAFTEIAETLLGCVHVLEQPLARMSRQRLPPVPMASRATAVGLP